MAERDHAVVTHDPLLGLPTAVDELIPYYTEDGTIVMLTAAEVEPTGAPANAAAAAPAADGATWAPAWSDGARLRISPADAGVLRRRMLDAYSLPASAPWPLRFDPSYAKKGASLLRWSAYRGATTFREFCELHHAYRVANPSDCWNAVNAASSEVSSHLSELKTNHTTPNAPLSPPPGDAYMVFTERL